ncbi:MAG: hypothetical protein K8F91_22555 [Candidatus Obscuribacterales bacterium]|nr:hypothetical protein [Candidatus Obscuribacterales bacterium]
MFRLEGDAAFTDDGAYEKGRVDLDGCFDADFTVDGTDSFQSLTGDKIASAVQIQLTVDVSTGLGPEGKSRMSATGTAATTGAGKQL